ncbi:MAG: hypothetical protein ACXVUE_23325 [Solirubrobacteraceae bacterium]
MLFFYSGKSKLFDQNGHAPPAIKKQFAGTFIDKVPGVDAAWVIFGVLEFAIFVLVVLSIVRGEFLPHKAKSILLMLKLPPNGPPNWLSARRKAPASP